jgi:hypothetical protein
MFDLLTQALIEIRTAVDGPLSDEDRRLIFVLANMAHNWPEALQRARSDDDYDAILRNAWQWREHADEWMSDRLRLLGVEPADLV